MYNTPVTRLVMVSDTSANLPCTHLDTVNDAAKVATCLIGDRPVEHVLAIFLDSARRITGVSIVSIGTAIMCLFDVKQVLRTVLMSHAECFVLAHNHPDGIPTPSMADMETTMVLRKACKTVGISMLAHVVVTADPTKFQEVITP